MMIEFSICKILIQKRKKSKQTLTVYKQPCSWFYTDVIIFLDVIIVVIIMIITLSMGVSRPLQTNLKQT